MGDIESYSTINLYLFVAMLILMVNSLVLINAGAMVESLIMLLGINGIFCTICLIIELRTVADKMDRKVIIE